MKDSDDFAAQPTAQNKYVMEEEAQAESILERVEKAAERLRKEDERRANAKEYAFSCYKCWKHGTRFLTVYEQCYDGPEQFVITCWKCKSHPKKTHASLAQVEKFARAHPEISISSFETRRPRPVWPPEPPLPTARSEAAREAWEKLFGKD